MKYFDRAALREVRNRMEEALKKVSDDLGISFEIGKIRYSSDMFRTQIVCVVANTSDDSSVAKVAIVQSTREVAVQNVAV